VRLTHRQPSTESTIGLVGFVNGELPTNAQRAVRQDQFVFHAGLGFGAFHHFIYRPFRSGGFAPGTPGRVRRLIEAGLATIPTPQRLAHPA
jgi:hypothetical protein